MLIHPQFWGILIFSFLLGMLVVFIGDWGMCNMDAQSRPNLFLGLSVMRLILSMIFISIVVFTGLEQRVLWVGNFFMVYLFYLVFEIVTILSKLRAISAEGENMMKIRKLTYKLLIISVLIRYSVSQIH